MMISWEWEMKKNSWIQYDDKTNETINQCKSTSIELTMNESKVQIDLVALRQKNITTGFERAIRCTIVDDVGHRYAWEWLDDKRRWHSHSADVVDQLETAYRRDDQSSIDVTIDGDVCAIDFAQMCYIKDNKEIKIRRIESNAKSSDAGNPVPSAARTRSKLKRNRPDDTNGTTSAAAVVDALPVNSIVKKPSKEPAAKKPSKEPAAKKPLKEPAAKKSASEKNKSKQTDSEIDKSTSKSVKRRFIMKGKAPVDPECTEKLDNAHVYSAGDIIYDVMLNQTNLQNNNNKYYLIQLLEDDDVKRYSVWMRWGRVGLKGQHSLIACGADVDRAISTFSQKFRDKTANSWEDRKNFQKKHGKYDMVQVDYDVGTENKSVDNVDDEKKEEYESTLDIRVQQLVKLICDIKAMEATVLEMEYDTTEAPLGKLTANQIKAGYSALKDIEACIEKQDFGTKLIDSVNAYYTRIPHCFGMRKPPLINTIDALKKELDLLEALADIEVAIRTLHASSVDMPGMNRIDRQYQAMKCALKPVDKEHEIFQTIEKYLQQTHASTHNTYKMVVRNIFAVEKDGEESVFRADVGNRKLLWHGSRLSNWYGILSQGLRIAPPEAPATGYMFGKGIYFADMSSKSANYCFPTQSKPHGLLLLAEVALGRTRDLLKADYNADKLTSSYDSVCGLGRIGPDPNDNVILDDGYTIPCGKPISLDANKTSGCTLNYNEYIVYKTNQIRIRYLVETEFVYLD